MICLSRYLPKTTSLTLRLQKTDDVVLANRANNVPDNGASGAVATIGDELDANLSDTTAGASAADNLDDASVNFLSLLSLNVLDCAP